MLKLTETLEPLLDVLSRGHYLRLVARPAWVMGDRPEGEVELDVPWSDAQHHAAQQLLSAPTRLPTGPFVHMVGNTLVLKNPPDAIWRADDLAREGFMSLLAARFLTAALSLGRNILVAGPWSLTTQIIATLVNEGRRPALLASPREALPRRWEHVADAAAAREYGADRIGGWSLSAQALVEAMGQLSGMIGWVDARRLDRALIRFEAGAEVLANRGNTPLHVLAGLDLVVVASQEGGPRVRQIAEITLIDEGYRPQLLFASGIPPAPTALMPLASPSFLGELALAGHTVLADELQAASRQKTPPSQTTSARVSKPSAPPVERRPVVHEPAPPAVELGPDALSQPGWELDRLEHSSSHDPAASAPTTTEEDATLAATYGLGPPPRPQSTKVSSSPVSPQHENLHPDDDASDDDDVS